MTTLDSSTTLVAARFDAWLAEQGDDMIVGVTLTPGNCPAAAFVAACGLPEPRVAHDGITIACEPYGVRGLTRRWLTARSAPLLCRFAERLDNEHGDEVRAVTAAEARRVLALVAGE